jgi:hypothetical protein
LILKPILQRLLQKAEDVINGGVSPRLRNDIFTPSPRDDKKDEFQIFSGQTHTVATKANNTQSQSRGTRPPLNQASSSSVPLERQSSHPYPEMHPMLVDQLNEFEGHLNAQIHTAYENDPQNVNPYLPVASSGYSEPFERSAQFHHSQPQMPPTQYSHQNTSHTSYQQPVYDSPTTPYGYPQDYPGALQYPEPVQHQHWSAERQYPNPESFSGESVSDHPYSNSQHPPAQAVDQHSLQDTWSSFVYTVGSPPPFAMD